MNGYDDERRPPEYQSMMSAWAGFSLYSRRLKSSIDDANFLRILKLVAQNYAGYSTWKTDGMNRKFPKINPAMVSWLRSRQDVSQKRQELKREKKTKRRNMEPKSRR